MISQTTLVNIKASIRPNENLHKFINEIYADSIEKPWFCSKDGDELYFRQIDFFSEYRQVWNKVLIESCQPDFDNLFHTSKWDLDVPFPKVEILETYEGSWIIEAALIIGATVSTSYAVIKGISEIPDMIEGIKKLRDGIAKKFQRNVNREVIELIERENVYLLPDQSNTDAKMHESQKIYNDIIIMQTDTVIDPRPMEALSPKDLCEHLVHIKVNVATNGIVVENLSDETMKNLRIGLFHSQNERHSWNFADAFIKNIMSLSGHQTIAIDFQSFLHDGKTFLLMNNHFRLDCWVQDNTGIYLFNFYLPQDI